MPDESDILRKIENSVFTMLFFFGVYALFKITFTIAIFIILYERMWVI